MNNSINQRKQIPQPASVSDIERRVMRGKRVHPSEMRRFICHPRGQMLAEALRRGL